MSVVAERVNASGALSAIPLCAGAPVLGGGESPALCTPAVVVGVTLTAAAFVVGIGIGMGTGKPK